MQTLKEMRYHSIIDMKTLHAKEGVDSIGSNAETAGSATISPVRVHPACLLPFLTILIVNRDSNTR